MQSYMVSFAFAEKKKKTKKAQQKLLIKAEGKFHFGDCLSQCKKSNKGVSKMAVQEDPQLTLFHEIYTTYRATIEEKDLRKAENFYNEIYKEGTTKSWVGGPDMWYS